MDEIDILKLGIDICRALEICQEKNIIHRDIKPENIFVNDRGDFKLGDFGIARTIEKTISNLSKKGTYAYMAPEVYRGMKYGSSVDIYSLGMVLYRYLNQNRMPFLPFGTIRYQDRENALERRMQGEIIPPPINGSDELKAAVLKALSFDAKERYRTPKEFREALENCLDALEITQSPLPVPADEKELTLIATAVNEATQYYEEDKFPFVQKREDTEFTGELCHKEETELFADTNGQETTDEKAKDGLRRGNTRIIIVVLILVLAIAISIATIAFGKMRKIPERLDPVEAKTESEQTKIEPEEYIISYKVDGNIGGRLSDGKSGDVFELTYQINKESPEITITAIPDDGYDFWGWSDGKTEETRKDSNFTKDFEIQAIFVKAELPAEEDEEDEPLETPSPTPTPTKTPAITHTPAPAQESIPKATLEVTPTPVINQTTPIPVPESSWSVTASVVGANGNVRFAVKGGGVDEKISLYVSIVYPDGTATAKMYLGDYAVGAYNYQLSLSSGEESGVYTVRFYDNSENKLAEVTVAH